MEEKITGINCQDTGSQLYSPSDVGQAVILVMVEVEQCQGK